MTSLRYLGDYIGWHLEDEVDRDHARVRAAHHGIEESLGFPEVNAIGAYHRAVREAARTSGLVARRVPETQLEVADDLCDPETMRSACRLAFDKDCYWSGHSTSDLVRCSVPDHEATVAFLDAYRRLGVVYRPDDLTIAIRRALTSWAGVRMIDRGGWWYVPSSSASLVERFAAWVGEVGGWPVVSPQYSDERTVAVLRVAVRRDVEARMNAFVERLRTIRESGSATRPATLARIADEIARLRGDAHTHGHILQYDLGSIGDRCTALVRALDGREEVDELTG